MVGLPLLALAGAGVFEAFGLATAYRDLRAGTDTVRASSTTLGTAPAGWTPERIDSADRRQKEGLALITRGGDRLRSDPLIGLAGLLPFAGDQVRALDDLTAAAQSAAVADGDAVAAARVYGGLNSGTGTAGNRAAALLTAAAPFLADAASRLGQSRDRVHSDTALPLLPPLARAVSTADAQLTTTAATAELLSRVAGTLPAAIGQDGKRRYLLLLANPTELRADGGFSGVVGSITLDHGDPTSVHLVDQASLYGKYRDRFPVPPSLARNLHEYNDSLEIGDAGWDPDFPTTAPLTATMWKSATGEDVNGVIELDPYAIAAMLKVTGPVDVAGVGTFDSSNFFEKINVLINVQGAGKDTTVPTIADAVLRKVLSQPPTAYAALSQAVVEQAIGGHIQLYSTSPELQALLHDQHLDGALLDSGSGDYLMLVDSNVGGNKADLYVAKHVDLKVEKPQSGLSLHQVTATYAMAELKTPVDLGLVPSYGGNRERHFRDFARFYLPETATVKDFTVTIDGKPAISNSVVAISNEHGKKVVAGYLDLPPGHAGEFVLSYEVPLDPDPRFDAVIQKQAGRPSLPTRVVVSRPGGIDSRDLTLDVSTDVRLSW